MNDWRNFDPIKKPPMINDMFLQVNVKAKAKQVLSLPAGAVHGNKVYVVEGNTLRVKPVTVLFEADGFAAIDAKLASTVQASDVVIVTDLLPAIDGMLVRTVME